MSDTQATGTTSGLSPARREILERHRAEAEEWFAANPGTLEEYRQEQAKQPQQLSELELVTRVLFESPVNGGPYSWKRRNSTIAGRERLAWCENAAKTVVATLGSNPEPAQLSVLERVGRHLSADILLGFIAGIVLANLIVLIVFLTLGR